MVMAMVSVSASNSRKQLHSFTAKLPSQSEGICFSYQDYKLKRNKRKKKKGKAFITI